MLSRETPKGISLSSCARSRWECFVFRYVLRTPKGLGGILTEMVECHCPGVTTHVDLVVSGTCVRTPAKYFRRITEQTQGTLVEDLWTPVSPTLEPLPISRPQYYPLFPDSSGTLTYPVLSPVLRPPGEFPSSLLSPTIDWNRHPFTTVLL